MLYRVNVRWRGEGRSAEEIVLTLAAASGDAAAAAAHERVQSARGGKTYVTGVMPSEPQAKTAVAAPARRAPKRKTAAKRKAPRR